MSRKHITTRHQVLSCDVCGRTLLRGEHADPFLDGGSRRLVCELCTPRAVHEGWLREGAGGAEDARRGGRERRGSLLRRLRRRDMPAGRPSPVSLPDRRSEMPPLVEEWQEEADEFEPGEGAPLAEAPPSPPPSRAKASRLEVEIERVNRSVHAVPANSQMKLERALELFNRSDAPRTVAGIARSLGAPVVAVRPSMTEGAIVSIVVAWELCWYRYEVDLADEASAVRLMAQGSELEELSVEEQTANAAADERGGLVMAA